MMKPQEAAGHGYSAIRGDIPRAAVRASMVIALFALAYAVLVLALGTIPLNILLRKVIGAAAMPAIWRNSIIQLAERTAAATIACWVGLAASGRSRGRLTGKGMIAVGAATSGALAGALDVGLHRLWMHQLIRAAQQSHLLGYAASLGITGAIALVVTLLMITRSTEVATER